MSTSDEHIPPALEAIVSDFEQSEGREKLELLLQYAEDFQDLPDQFQNNLHNFEPVPECMTPVSIFYEFRNGGIYFYFIIPASSPTVRGFASILSAGLQGASPEVILSIPTDFYLRMGLDQVLTYQRLNGFSAILAHLKLQAVKYLHESGSQQP